MTDPPPAKVHLRRSEVPDALAVIEAALSRQIRHGRVAGYEATADGALVCWPVLLGNDDLWSTEIACLRIAEGLATLEGHHGASPAMLPSLAAAFTHQLELLGAAADVLAALQSGAGSWLHSGRRIPRLAS